MKMVFDKDNFLDLLTLASKFTSTKLSSVVSLQGVMIKSDGKQTELISTNLNSFFRAKMKTPSADSYSIVVEPRKIMEFLSYLPSGKIDTETDGKKIVFEKDKTKGVFQ